MKKTLLLLLSLAVCTSMFLSGCKKIIDEIIKHPNGAADHCRIEEVNSQFQIFEGPLLDDIAIYSYNPKGNPLSIIHSTADRFEEEEPGAYINMYFDYYPDGRLAVFLQNGLKKEGSRHDAILWHKYTYEGSNVIIDSVFVYASGDLYTGDFSHPWDGVESGVSRLELDAYGRIVKETIFAYPGASPYIKTYSYDNAGNLVKPGVTYNTNWHNWRQTHNVWRLVTRDYSINSADNEVEAYNSKNLPSVLRIYSLGLFQLPEYPPPGATEFRNINVKYRCK